jgi:hypothetical protein
MTWLPALHLLLDTDVRRPVTEEALELVTACALRQMQLA